MSNDQLSLWQIKDESGTVYQPVTVNQLKEFASKNRLTTKHKISHPTTTKGEWVSVARVPAIANLIPGNQNEAPAIVVPSASAAINEQPQWRIRHPNGSEHGPFEYEDLENFLIQGRLTIESMVLHPSRTQNKWITVSNVPKLIEVLTNHLSHKRNLNLLIQETKLDKPSFSKASMVTVLVSAIANIVIGLFWFATVIGFPIAVCMWALCICEFVSYSRHKKYSLDKFRSVTLFLGIFEIILGLLNTISLVCGIITLINRPAERD